MKKYFVLSFLLLIGAGLNADEGFWGKWVNKVATEVEKVKSINMTNCGPYQNTVIFLGSSELKNFKKNIQEIKFSKVKYQNGAYDLTLENTNINSLLLHDEEALKEARKSADNYQKLQEWKQNNPKKTKAYTCLGKANKWWIRDTGALALGGLGVYLAAKYGYVSVN